VLDEADEDLGWDSGTEVRMCLEEARDVGKILLTLAGPAR